MKQNIKFNHFQVLKSDIFMTCMTWYSMQTTIWLGIMEVAEIILILAPSCIKLIGYYIINLI